MKFNYYLFVLVNVAVFYNSLFATTIRNIHIELPASNMQIAREQAIDQARIIAISQYAKLNPEHSSRINLLKDDSLALSKIVQDVNVVREKFERQRYTCFINVVVNQAQLDRFLKPKAPANPKNIDSDSNTLKANDHKFNEAAVPLTNKKILVIPIYISEDESLLWEDDNNWRLSWQVQEGTQAKGSQNNYTVPLADLRDQRACSIEDVMTERAKNLSALLERYHQHMIVVTTLKKLGASDNYELLIKTASLSGQIKIYEPYNIDNLKDLSHEARYRHAQYITLKTINEGHVDDNLPFDPQLKFIKDPVEETIIETKPKDNDKKLPVIDNPNDPSEPLTNISKTDTNNNPKKMIEDDEAPPLKAIELKEKPSNNLQGESATVVPLVKTIIYRAKFSTLGQWQSIRKAIQKVNGISNLRVLNLNTNSASLSFDFQGNETDLMNILNRDTFKVSSLNNGDSIIELKNNTPQVTIDGPTFNESLGY